MYIPRLSASSLRVRRTSRRLWERSARYLGHLDRHAAVGPNHLERDLLPFEELDQERA